MPVRITSQLPSGPIVFQLTSGDWVRLSPGETSEELRDVEVENNPKIDKLREQRVIAVESVEGGTAGSGDEGASESMERSGGETGPVSGKEPNQPDIE